MASFKVKSGVLTITVPLKDATPSVSKSGKSKVYASTNGNKSLNELCPDGAETFGTMKVGLNIYDVIR